MLQRDRRSMIRAGGLTMLSAASDSVMLWATVNAVTNRRKPAHRAAEQQQADEKEQMVGTDENVMDPGREEFAHDGERPLPRAGEVLEPRAAPVENRLGQRVALVDIQKTSGGSDRTGKNAAPP